MSDVFYPSTELWNIWSTIIFSVESTKKRINNNPVCWWFIKWIFHTAMITSQSDHLLYHLVYSETLIRIFYWLSHILSVAKLLTYAGFNIMCCMMLMFSSFYHKRMRIRQPKGNRILGIYRRRMILPEYMVLWEWMVYLRKLNRTPNLIIDRCHQLEMNAICLPILLCGNSVAVVNEQWAMSSSIAQSSCKGVYSVVWSS